MENTNKLEIKKYILLADGRVLESSKLKDVWEDYSDICLVDADAIYEYNGLDKTKSYIEEVIPNWREGESDDSKFTEIIDSKDLLFGIYDESFKALPLSTYIRKKDWTDALLIDDFQYNDYKECEEYILYDNCYDLEDDEEVFLGSWYKDGMRFVAKWDRKKKDWVLI